MCIANQGTLGAPVRNKFPDAPGGPVRTFYVGKCESERFFSPFLKY